MNPILSICVPSYNRVNLLKRLSKQLLALQAKDVEFVFNDDKSPDPELATFLNSLATVDSRVSVYFNKKNLGIRGNYYKTLKLAKGKYVMLLSNEDQLPGHFEKKILPLLKDQADYDGFYGFLERANSKDYAYTNEHPTKSTSDFNYIKNNYPQIIFRGHISGHILKKSTIDFDILHEISQIEDNYWPIAPITLMVMKTENVLFLKESVVVIGADEKPETENQLQGTMQKKSIKHLFSFKKRADLYSKYVQLIISETEQSKYYEILAKYFLFFAFNKKRNGISRIKDINAIKKHDIIGVYFVKLLNQRYIHYYSKFYWSCINKYLSIVSTPIRKV